jgi:hypothetical protein
MRKINNKKKIRIKIDIKINKSNSMGGIEKKRFKTKYISIKT